MQLLYIRVMISHSVEHIGLILVLVVNKWCRSWEMKMEPMLDYFRILMYFVNNSFDIDAELSINHHFFLSGPKYKIISDHQI